MGTYNYMPRLLIAVFIAACVGIPASAKDVFRVKPAEKYSAKQHQGEVILGVKPYRSEKEMKAAFGKAKPYKFGVLPILVVLYNGSDHALSLAGLKVRFITADREGLEPLTEQDLKYFQPSTKPKERPAYIPPIPGLGRGGLKKGPLAKPEIAQRAFQAPIIPPQSSVSGFFYYMTGREPDPVPGGSVYLSGVRDLTTGQELFYFEIELKK